MTESAAETRINLKEARQHGIPPYKSGNEKWDAKLDTSIFITDQSQAISHRKIIRVS